MCRFLRPETAFFLALWPILAVVFRRQGFYDPGSLWHTVVGELILTSGFPRTDPFTFTFEGRPWIPQQWGAEVLMALAHRVGGLDGMLLGFIVVVAGLWTWVFARMRAGGMAWMLAAALTGAALLAGGYHYFVRPHMATIVLLGWTMGCVVDFDRGRAAGLWRLAGLIPLYVVWTNLHGGVLGGTMTLGLAVAGWYAEGLLRRGPVRSWRTAAVLAGVAAACALTPFVNPFGMEMIRTWQRIVGSTAMKEIVVEHLPLDIASTEGRVLVGFGALYLLLFAGTLPRVRLTGLIPCIWLVLSFQSIRQGPLFAVTAAIALADFWPDTVWHRLLKRHGDTLATDPAPEPRPTGLDPRAMTLPAILVAAVVALQAAGVSAPVVGRGWAELDPRMVPVDLTDAVRSYQREVGTGTRMFNDVNLGGFLIYFAPGLKIYGDDRFELCGDDWLREYQDFVYEHPERIDDLADRYGFDRALVTVGQEKPEKLEEYLLTAKTPGGKPRWTEVARGERAALFARTHGP